MSTISARRLQGRSVSQFQDDLSTAITGEEQLMQILKQEYGIEYRRTACGVFDELIDEKQVKCTPDYQIQLPPYPQWYWLEIKEVYKDSPYITFKIHQLKHYIELRSLLIVAYNTNRKTTGKFSEHTQVAVIYPRTMIRLLELPHSTFSCFPGVPAVRVHREEFAKYMKFKYLFSKESMN